jgi:hypothetical protein
MTVAPSAASCSAIALPMPRLAPVTSAISPCKDLLIVIPIYILFTAETQRILLLLQKQL